MPYSDEMPGYVIPDDYEWRQRMMADVAVVKSEGGGVRWCPDYRAETRISDQATMLYNQYHPKCYPCANANPMGDRNHNWCYRCPAGLMLVQLHIYDAERERDRAIRVG